MEWKDFSSEERIAFLKTIVTYEEAKELTRQLKEDLSKKRAIQKETVYPCPRCNHKYAKIWYTCREPYMWRKMCNYCGFLGYAAKSKWQMTREWNRAVIDEINKCYQVSEYRDDWRKKSK